MSAGFEPDTYAADAHSPLLQAVPFEELDFDSPGEMCVETCANSEGCPDFRRKLMSDPRERHLFEDREDGSDKTGTEV